MIKRILAVVLAAVLGFVSFAASFPVVASAYSVGTLGYLEAFWDFVQYMKETSDNIYDNKADYASTLEGFKARATVIANFKPYRDLLPLPDNASKTELLDCLTLFVGTDNYSAIEEKYGHDIAVFYNEHNVDFNDFFVNCIIPLFNGLSDFVDMIYSDEYNDYTTDEKGNVQIPADDFIPAYEECNDIINPTITDSPFHRYSWRDMTKGVSNGTLGSQWATNVGTYDTPIYIQMYMYRNGNFYYRPYQFKLFFVFDKTIQVKNPLDDGSPLTVPSYNAMLTCIYYKNFDGTSLDTTTVKLGEVHPKFRAVTCYDENGKQFKELQRSDPMYINLGFKDNDLCVTLYGTTAEALCMDSIFASWSLSLWNVNVSNFTSLYCNSSKSWLLSSDVTHYLPWGSATSSQSSDPLCDDVYGFIHFWKQQGNSSRYVYINNNVDWHDHGDPSGRDTNVDVCDEGCTCDWGFLVSPSQFNCVYEIDTNKIPSNSIITINGDNVYNYTITDNSTGNSSSIKEFIDNNYTYPENGGGSQGGGNGGGNVGGNITVGGQVDVGGRVDVNVNINGGSGESGSIVNPDDFTSADNVDLNKYYDEAVEQSTGFQKFLKDFFGFFPAELLGLILFAVALAIVCRVFGR